VSAVSIPFLSISSSASISHLIDYLDFQILNQVSNEQFCLLDKLSLQAPLCDAISRVTLSIQDVSETQAQDLKERR
jgi:hypothetical protein